MYSINPDRTSPWNDLPLLPIEDQYYRDLNIYERLVEAKHALGILHGRSAIIPNQGILINTLYLKEAKQSSAIENIFTTDDELYRAYSKDQKETQDGPAKEVLKYREAIWHGYNRIRKGERISQEMIIELFSTIKNTNEGIRSHYRDIYISRGGSEPGLGERYYTPPRADGIVKEKLDNLIEFLNHEADTIDPLLKMIIGHFQFEAIHPFSDGNGRTGRILNGLYLVQSGLLNAPILYMSRKILTSKNEYYYNLAGVTQRGEWKNWILYMLDVVEQTSWNTYNMINNIGNSKENIQQAIESETKIRNVSSLLNVLYTMPFVTVKHLVQKNIYSENTARNNLNQLSKMGIVEKMSIEGHHYYKNLDLYQILSD